MNPFPSPFNEPDDEAGEMTIATRASLAGIANFRQKLLQGRTLPLSHPDDPEVRWDVHEERLDVIESLVRAQRSEDDDLRAKLTRELIQDFQTELAAKMEACSQRMGSVTDTAEESAEEQEL